MDEEMRRKAQIALVNPIRGDIPYGFGNDTNDVSEEQPKYKVGDVVPKGGKLWRITSLLPDGTPDDVEEVR
jgi:hypothetical protein